MSTHIFSLHVKISDLDLWSTKVFRPVFELVHFTYPNIIQPPSYVPIMSISSISDRDVFSGSAKIGDVTMVSKEQLLLDLAGGDKIRLQLAFEMVKKLDKL